METCGFDRGILLANSQPIWRHAGNLDFFCMSKFVFLQKLDFQQGNRPFGPRIRILHVKISLGMVLKGGNDGYGLGSCRDGP